jgi:Zn-dependent protease
MRLVHAAELRRLASVAEASEAAGDISAALASWRRAEELLPPGVTQRARVAERMQALSAALDGRGPAPRKAPAKPASGRGKAGAAAAAAGVALAKSKAILVLLLGNGKLLLLGLTKIPTLLTMLIYARWMSGSGATFGIGLVASIYVHEVGHVAALRRYGIEASAPMFVPGFGAFVRMKQYPGNVGEDARVGLAGPIWGLGSAIAAWLAAIATGLPVWYAIAHTAAWLNLFNLLPIWQLDGGRGFRALTRRQRGMAAGVAIAMWALTHQTILLLIALGAGYRLFSRDYPADDDNIILMQYAGLIVLLSLLMTMTDRIAGAAF